MPVVRRVEPVNVGEARARILRVAPLQVEPGPGRAQVVGEDGKLVAHGDGKVSVPVGGKWARYAGKLGAALTVTVSAAAIRKGGHEPNDPDDADVDFLQEALEEGLRLKFGDGPVPWWLGAAFAAGGVYAGMRVGAAKLPPKDAPIDGAPAPAAPSSAPARPAPGVAPGPAPAPAPPRVRGFRAAPPLAGTENP